MPPRNDFFTGREKILSRLHATLKAGGRAAIKQAISGLGGIGKTATATEYAHRYANDYAHVLWTGAADAAALNDGFARLARELGLPQRQKSEETVAEVKRWLAQNPGWLLILDNADAPDVLTPFLPSAAVGAILLTSRADVFDGLGVVHPLALDVMRGDEAAEFLFARIGKDVARASEDERAAARELAETLGGLALALEQAGAYVLARPRYTLRRYAEEYRAETLRLLGKAKPKTGDYQETVLTTWSVSFRAAADESAAAAEILRVSAFLAPDLIPCAVLEAGKAEIGTALAQEGTIDDALAALTRYSLIRLDAANGGYAVHRLVQAVIQDGMDAKTRREWAERAVAAVNAAFPDVSDFNQWVECEGFLPHGTHLAGVIEEFGLETAEAGRLLNQCGYFLKERARYAEAKPLYERSLAIDEKAYGANHPEVATDLNNLAALYDSQGEYGKALPLYERSLAIREKARGGEHPSTALSLNNLAGLYYRQGDYGKALPLYERSLAILEKALGGEHPLTAGSLNNLALLYKEQGEYGKALPLFERSLAIDEKAYGANHPEVATDLNNLAGLYEAQGEYGKASPMYERSLAILEKALGKEHPNTRVVANNLAGLRGKLSPPA